MVPEGSLTNAIACTSTCGTVGSPGPVGVGIAALHVAPPFVERITHSNVDGVGGGGKLATAAPPRKAILALAGSTLITLSYQHWLRQTSGAEVCVQEEPPFVVTKTPRFVREPSPPSAIEA